MRFSAAPEYQVFPSPGRPLTPYQAAVRACEETRPLVREADPDAVVVDILTVAGALAAEAEERRWVTLIPHVLPTPAPGLPPFSIGARLPRTVVGRAVWRSLYPVVRGGERQGREQLNEARRRVGLGPLPHLHGGISRELALVGTFPQLEYPRVDWPSWARVTGPLLWEQPFDEVQLPPGDDPLVLVAPSTSQDPSGRLLSAALSGLAGEPVRVLATTNRRSATDAGSALPANARLVDWLSYARTMPHCDLVVCHAGHGTVARALASGVPVLACPVAGDMAENAARVAWAGVGASLPRRLVTPRGVRLGVRALLGDAGVGGRVDRLAAWASERPGTVVAAEALEGFVEQC